MTIPSLLPLLLLLGPPVVVGGVPLLDPTLLPRDEEEDTVRVTDGTSVGGAGTSRQKSSLPSQRCPPRSERSLSSRFRSKAERYRSYDSRKFLSTRAEKMSSPRGLVAGGIEGMGREEEEDGEGLRVGEGERERVT
jgi:hypothetical protein